MASDRIPAGELEDVFGRVAHELRITILAELWAAEPDALAFSALQERVGVRDSGKFNYHLGQLTPAFVRQGEDGYELTGAGRRLIGAAVSGAYTDEADVGPVDAGCCIYCDGPVEGEYERGLLTLDCTACDRLIARLPVPPVVVAERDPASLPGAVSDHFLTQISRLARGFCKLCHGRTEPTLAVASEHEPVTDPPALDVVFECQHCGDPTHLNVGVVVMDHPAVVAFLADVGVDPRDTYLWELSFVLDPDVTVVSEDPARLELALDVDGETLELTVDESATVVDYERL